MKILNQFKEKWTRRQKIRELESKVKRMKNEKKSDKIRSKDITRTIKKVKKKEKLTAAERKRRFKKYLEMAGFENASPVKLTRTIFWTTIGIATLITVYLAVFFATAKEGFPLGFIFTVIALIWTFGFLLTLLLIWLGTQFYIDMKMFSRKLALEAVLPDFLQLTSANIRAGMPIDRALWYAVRPRFGVLAKEIEMVAKENLSGTDLNSALMNFANKYDSVLLKRSISLLIEGIEAGGEIGDLLNKISLNIQETRILKKEMAASVTTYVIFISVASVGAAPVMFALAAQLLTIIQNITSRMAENNVQSSGALSFSISGDAVAIGDFHIFAVTSLTLTAIFSAAIISTIKKGNIKEGISKIPVFIVISLLIYWSANIILRGMLGSLT